MTSTENDEAESQQFCSQATKRRRLSASTMSKLVRTIVHTPHAPAAIGPYSQAVRVGQTVYVSGSVGLVPETGELVAGGVEEQAHQALKNMGKVLEAAGSDFSKVVKTTVLLRSMDDFARVNEVYKQYFKDKYPARAAYAAAGLPRNALVEIEAVAITGELEDAKL